MKMHCLFSKDNVSVFLLLGNLLYWCDGLHHTIESVKLDGSDRKVLIKASGTHFFGIDFMEPNLYITDWRSQYVYTFVYVNFINTNSAWMSL